MASRSGRFLLLHQARRRSFGVSTVWPRRPSEQNLDAELYASRTPRRLNRTEARRAHENIRKAQIGVVQEVECLHPKLKVGTLPEHYILDQRDVDIPITGSGK